MPTIATSQLPISLNSGNLAKVLGPANRGTFVPLIGCIGSFFFVINFIYKIKCTTTKLNGISFMFSK